MASGRTCVNPMCTCNPCRCVGHCHCGTAALGDLEHQVMDVLWQEPQAELTVKQVASHFPGRAYTTIATVLDRLVGKELVIRRSAARVNRYTAVGSRDARAALLMQQALAAAPDRAAALERFAAALTPADAAALRRSARR